VLTIGPQTIYGFDIKSIDDPYVKLAEEGISFVEDLIPGIYLVDSFPFRKQARVF
jgi:hypothetical protein